MGKRFVAKKKHKFKIRYILYLILVYLSFQFTFYITDKVKLASSNEEFITALLNDSSYNLKYEKSSQNIFYHLFNFLTSIDIKNPITILEESFGFKQKEKEEVIKNDDYVVPGEVKEVGYIKNPLPITSDNPRVYIYSSHQLEGYNSDYLDGTNITPNVLMASYLLKERLEKLAIPTLVEEKNFTQVMKEQGLNHADSYRISRSSIESTLKKYPNLDLLIDLHRDALSKENSTTTINGKKYAKILFVVGMEYKNYEKNLALANKINNLVKQKYPSLTRGVITKKGADVDGVYNQDMSPKMILLETGGQDNTIDEVLNTLEIMAGIIKETIS